MVGQAREITTARKNRYKTLKVYYCYGIRHKTAWIWQICFVLELLCCSNCLAALSVPCVQTTTHTHIWHFGPGSLKYKHPVQFCSIKEMLCKAGPCLSNLWLSAFLLWPWQKERRLVCHQTLQLPSACVAQLLAKYLSLSPNPNIHSPGSCTQTSQTLVIHAVTCSLSSHQVWEEVRRRGYIGCWPRSNNHSSVAHTSTYIVLHNCSESHLSSLVLFF